MQSNYMLPNDDNNQVLNSTNKIKANKQLNNSYTNPTQVTSCYGHSQIYLLYSLYTRCH